MLVFLIVFCVGCFCCLPCRLFSVFRGSVSASLTHPCWGLRYPPPEKRTKNLVRILWKGARAHLDKIHALFRSSLELRLSRSGIKQSAASHGSSTIPFGSRLCPGRSENAGGCEELRELGTKVVEIAKRQIQIAATVCPHLW